MAEQLAEIYGSHESNLMWKTFQIRRSPCAQARDNAEPSLRNWEGVET